jgi:VanZ family protein
VTRRLLYLLILFVLAGLLLFVPLPIAPTYAGRTIENAGHTPLFFLVTLGVLVAMRNHPRLHGVRLYAFAGLIGAGAGLLSEVIQRPLARDASWEDVLADVVGAILALAVFALFDRRTRLPTWQRLGALAVALSCVAIFLAPIVRMARAYVHRNGQFPVIADFHWRIEKAWTLSFGVNREIVGDALEVDLFADEFPGVSFHEPGKERSAKDKGSASWSYEEYVKAPDAKLAAAFGSNDEDEEEEAPASSPKKKAAPAKKPAAKKKSAKKK